MRLRLITIPLAALLLLTGCSTAQTPTNAGPSSSSTTPPQSPTATASALVISADDVEYMADGRTQTIGLADGAGLVTLFSGIANRTPAPTQTTEPTYNVTLTTYDFGGVKVVVTDGKNGSVLVTAADLSGVPIKTTDGLHVGSTRADAAAAGSRGVFDENGDGIFEYVAVGQTPAPGTDSLTTPGTTGSDYVMLHFDGDVVQKLQVPANDYSDL